MNGSAVTEGLEDKVFSLIVHIILIFCTLCAILPFVMLISSSLTSEYSLLHDGYNFWPKEFSVYAYQYIFSGNGARVLRAYAITIFVTVFGTALSLLVTPLLAYPLSRRDYPRAKIFTFLVFFTMLFNGGMTASYIMWTQIFSIKDTIWALIFPNGLLFTGFNVILYKNYFSANIHPSLLEAARIDGAGEWYIYFRIVLPLSLPIMATMGLMTGLNYWNNWTNGLYFITDTRLYSLQYYLKTIMDDIRALADSTQGNMSEMPSVGIRMAIAVIGTIPILLLYPFFQKAFVAGISLGGVKE